MMWLKACRHCHGDLFETSDFDGPIVQCLQCGRSAPSQSQVRARSRSSVVPSRGRRRSPASFTPADIGPMIAGQNDGADAWAQ